jgi:hypothetical protein
LAAKLVAGHGAGMSENPGLDARMPPGLTDGFPGGRDVGRVHGDFRRSGDGGRTPALERRGGAVLCGLGRRGQERAAARRIPIPPSR